MRAAQAQATQQAQPMTSLSQTSSNNIDFSKLVKTAVDQVNATQQASGQLKTAFEMGDPNVSLADAMIASQKASVAFEATVQVRNKMIKAYEEIMRMSI
ncbi:UNVERIFIED_CONTAM: hypothetical protein GTU68_051109 [Idotea baltica]|nr:hypothetical protein [Idotea baltica]